MSESSAVYNELAREGRVSVLEFYLETLKRRGYAADSSQMRAVEALQRLFEDWTVYKARRSNAFTSAL